MTTIAFQPRSRAGDDHWHSILISLLRGLAAIEVAASHLRAEMMPSIRTLADPPLWYSGLAFATGFAHQAVLVFFVISGWLVGGSLLDKFGQPDALAHYAIDRMTRLWTVLIPTFLLTLVFGVAAGAIDAHRIDFSAANDYSALAFAGNLVGLQTVALPPFGGNFALWSLANETWYYLLFPLLVVLFAARGVAARVGCAACLAALGFMLPAAMLGYFVIWLLGVAFSRIRIDCGAGVRTGLLLLLAAVSVWYRMTGELEDFDLATLGQDLVCSLVFLVFLSSMQFKAAATSKLALPLGRIGAFIASFSFTLYVLHLPLIGLIKYWLASGFGVRQLSPHAPPHVAVYASMLVLILAASWLSYLLFESQTDRLRRLAKRLLIQRQPHRAAAAALGAD